MFTKVSVLIPTRRRLDRLRTMLTSYEATVNDAGNSELVFRIDDDDTETQEFLFHHRAVVGPRFKGYDSMPVFLNEMSVAANGDVLMLGNDDMIFKTPGWPRMILDAANNYPDGLFDLGVMTHNADHYPFATVSRKAAECMGFMVDPRIFWSDIFLRDVMAAFGRCVMVPQVEIEHDWAGWKPDSVFLESDKDIMARDPDYWTGTHATAVTDAVIKLRALT